MEGWCSWVEWSSMYIDKSYIREGPEKTGRSGVNSASCLAAYKASRRGAVQGHYFSIQKGTVQPGVIAVLFHPVDILSSANIDTVGIRITQLIIKQHSTFNIYAHCLPGELLYQGYQLLKMQFGDSLLATSIFSHTQNNTLICSHTHKNMPCFFFF